MKRQYDWSTKEKWNALEGSVLVRPILLVKANEFGIKLEQTDNLIGRAREME